MTKRFRTWCLSGSAMLLAVVVLPTPPFWLKTAIARGRRGVSVSVIADWRMTGRAGFLPGPPPPNGNDPGAAPGDRGRTAGDDMPLSDPVCAAPFHARERGDDTFRASLADGRSTLPNGEVGGKRKIHPPFSAASMERAFSRAGRPAPACQTIADHPSGRCFWERRWRLYGRP